LDTKEVLLVVALVWAWSCLALIGFAANSIYRNRFLVGLRGYPRKEHLDRWEKWTQLPVLTIFTSAVVGVASSLIVTGEWLYGFLLVEASMFVTLFLGLVFGLVRRKRPRPIWEKFESLVPMHAEIMAWDENELPASRVQIRLMRSNLETLLMQGKTPTRRVLGLVAAGLGSESSMGWNMSVSTAGGRPLRIPAVGIVGFLVGRKWTVAALVVCLVCSIYLGPHIAAGWPAVVAVVLSVLPALFAYLGTYAELVYQARSYSDDLDMTEEVMRAIQRIELRETRRRRYAFRPSRLVSRDWNSQVRPVARNRTVGLVPPQGVAVVSAFADGIALDGITNADLISRH
jgi:hypothetical protein